MTTNRTMLCAAVAMVGLALGASPAAADDVPLPTAQAVAMHAEFLTQAPTPDNPGVTCIVDTGVNSNPDTDAAVIGRQTIYPGDGTDGDPVAHHGTYLAMNIAAPTNGWGMVGIAPQTRILSIRAIDNGAHTFQSVPYKTALDQCIQAKVQGGVNVTAALLALGHADTDTSAVGQAVQDEISTVRAHGISVVVAGGNDRGGGVQWPARFGPAFAVGGSDSSGNFCVSSSRGPELDLSALGCGADSALWDTGAPATIDGTSTSAGLVAGVLTALRAYRPELTPDEAEQVFTSTADRLGAGKVINVAAAFRAAGLGPMVDAYRPPPPAVPPAPVVINVSTVCPDGRALCQKPQLGRATRRQGTLTLTVTAVPPGAFLQARVSNRWHSSTTASVTLRLRRWKRIFLRFAGIDGDRSPSLVIKPRDLAAKKRRNHHRQGL
jgi:Subtilase family